MIMISIRKIFKDNNNNHDDVREGDNDIITEPLGK